MRPLVIELCKKQNSKMISVSLYNLPVSVFSAAGNMG